MNSINMVYSGDLYNSGQNLRARALFWAPSAVCCAEKKPSLISLGSVTPRFFSSAEKARYLWIPMSARRSEKPSGKYFFTLVTVSKVGNKGLTAMPAIACLICSSLVSASLTSPSGARLSIPVAQVSASSLAMRVGRKGLSFGSGMVPDFHFWAALPSWPLILAMPFDSPLPFSLLHLSSLSTWVLSILHAWANMCRPCFRLVSLSSSRSASKDTTWPASRQMLAS
mmetsp:Transcript_42227/g.92062  ORF Transcript_42227/g.92062 Transcript_42227/m.92062 type:complete len:226 (-) Transcript_42227:318-995(-)